MTFEGIGVFNINFDRNTANRAAVFNRETYLPNQVSISCLPTMIKNQLVISTHPTTLNFKVVSHQKTFFACLLQK